MLHDVDPRLSELAEREAIRDCLCRSAFANDMCDAELWKSTYWPDGHENHAPMFVGNAHEFIDVIIPMIRTGMRRTWHQIGTPLIRLDGAQARVMSHALAFARIKDVAEWSNVLAGVRYVDLFERRGSDWRILTRVTQTDWTCAAPDVPLGLGSGIDGEGARGPADPAKSLFSAVMGQLKMPVVALMRQGRDHNA